MAGVNVQPCPRRFKTANVLKAAGKRFVTRQEIWKLKAQQFSFFLSLIFTVNLKDLLGLFLLGVECYLMRIVCGVEGRSVSCQSMFQHNSRVKNKAPFTPCLTVVREGWLQHGVKSLYLYLSILVDPSYLSCILYSNALVQWRGLRKLFSFQRRTFWLSK